MQRAGIVLGIVVALLCALPASAASIGGSWSGRYAQNVTDTCCTNITGYKRAGSFLITFDQPGGAAFTGSIVFFDFIDVTHPFQTPPFACDFNSPFTFALPISGSQTGTSITGTVTQPDGPPVPFSATVSGDGNSISGTVVFDSSNCTNEGPLTFSVSREAGTSVNVTGTWTGPYSFTNDCPITFNGQLTLALSQSGLTVTGSATFTNVLDNDVERCVFTGTATLTTPIQGTISGDTLVIPPSEGPEGDAIPQFTIKVTGSVMRGALSDQDGTGSFTLTLGGGTATILSLSATPASVRQGGASTLLYKTANATSVSISGVSGSFPPAGSITVSPSSTTTYTLTASGPGGNASANVTVSVITKAIVNISTLLQPIVQSAGSPGSGSFTLSNSGGAPSSVTLTKGVAFFSMTPETFVLASGATQRIDITTNAVGPGTLAGDVRLAGDGVPTGLSVPVRVLSSVSPTGTARLTAATNRVDVVAPAADSPNGTARFTNSGSSTIEAIASTDVPWIVLPPAPVTLAAGESRDVTFQIVRARRPDASAPTGSISGSLSLSALGTLATRSSNNGAPTLAAPVTVIDTARPAVAGTSIPFLPFGERALFIPGVGHVQGSVGLFISDVAILNSGSATTVDELELYYLPASGSAAQTSQLTGVAPNTPLNLADVVNATFNADSQVGTLQIRSTALDQISVAANVFNASNARGTYGTALPVFASDRSVPSTGVLFLTGLLRGSTSHTNLYLQETSGASVSATTEFLDANGIVVSTRKDNVSPFALTSVSNVVPEGAVSARITNDGGSLGRLVAFATPVDDSSGDTWTVVDWKQQFGQNSIEPLIIPVAGAVRGANETYFRTDVAMMNVGTVASSGTMRYYGRSGELVDKQVSLDPQKTLFVKDVVSSLFGITTDTVGYVVYTPSAGGVVITSRTYTTVAGSSATFGSAVPTLPASVALKAGEARHIGSLDDAALSTILAQRPGSFRTNFGLVETSGNAATVRVTLRYSFATGGLVEGRATASQDYALAPRQFLLVNNVARAILGNSRDTSLGDLRNIQVDFEVIAGSGEVMVFTSSIDNGTGDSILRTE